MTSRKNKTDKGDEPPVDELVRDTFRLIALTFVYNAEVIARSQKPETLLKMIQSCKELKPVDRSNQELWKLIQKVRHEVLGGRATAPASGRKPGRKVKA